MLGIGHACFKYISNVCGNFRCNRHLDIGENYPKYDANQHGRGGSNTVDRTSYESSSLTQVLINYYQNNITQFVPRWKWSDHLVPHATINMGQRGDWRSASKPGAGQQAGSGQGAAGLWPAAAAEWQDLAGHQGRGWRCVHLWLFLFLSPTAELSAFSYEATKPDCSNVNHCQMLLDLAYDL